MPWPAHELGILRPIRAISSPFTETRYIGFDFKEQRAGGPNPFLPLQIPRQIHILNAHVVRQTSSSHSPRSNPSPRRASWSAVPAAWSASRSTTAARNFARSPPGRLSHDHHSLESCSRASSRASGTRAIRNSC